MYSADDPSHHASATVFLAKVQERREHLHKIFRMTAACTVTI
jgi:hypothetical protein